MLDNEFPPLGGGTGVVNFHVLKQLAFYENFWIDLITSSRSRESYEVEQFSEQIVIYKVPVNNENIHHSTNIELIRYIVRGFGLGRRLLKQHSYDLSFAFAGVPAGIMSYAFKVLYGLPYVVSLQGPDVPGFEERYNYLYPFLKVLLRVVWSNASFVTAISEEHRRLAHNTLPSLEIPIIYNGVETDVFTPTSAFHAGVNILCVGRLIERKGQHFLLKAFAELCKRLPEMRVRLMLVGTGDFESRLVNLAGQLGIGKKVIFKGFVPRREMPKIYHWADIFVLPSQNEGMSIALLEAMASGLPVVVTNTGGTEELVQHESNGYVVEWGSVEQITQALESLTLDEDLRGSMGRISRRISMRFCWPQIVQQYVDLWEQVQ
jgi:glycosyltransferase involved in cell wall biosynthesis